MTARLGAWRGLRAVQSRVAIDLNTSSITKNNDTIPGWEKVSEARQAIGYGFVNVSRI
jgi:hypothetical protein